MFCNRCGHRNPEKAMFCSACGAPMERAGPDQEAATTSMPAASLLPIDLGGEPLRFEPSDLLYGVPAGGAVLVVTRGPNSGSRFVLGSEPTLVVTIGRHPESDIFLDDITVSRRHAEVSNVEGTYWAHDAGSLNGTYLNRQSIDKAPLSSGDELQIGKFRLLFLAPVTAAGGASPAGRA